MTEMFETANNFKEKGIFNRDISFVVWKGLNYEQRD